MTTRAVVIGVGHYLPERVVPNSEFEATLDTTDEWIRTRSGIERRHFAAEGETTSQMAANAGPDRHHHRRHLDRRPDLSLGCHHGAGRAGNGDRLCL